MAFPLVYEINTRCWLRELSEKAGVPVTLATVPQSQFDEWRRLGFSHIWLMGAWTTGPLAREKALAAFEQQPGSSSSLGDLCREDIAGSPYAIAEYQVPPQLGGEAGLQGFRQRLHDHGLKLLLDFVPNHLGLDHAWVRDQPELFVHSSSPMPETFSTTTAVEANWLAHGKDPNFPAWTDTVQLDYRRAKTRARMTELLGAVASRCDGLRCDMAMLLLNVVFCRTWERFPSAEATPGEEFWAAAIAQTRRAFPNFLFLAEAYWGLEPELQKLGFDYTYDKSLYDKLVAGNAAGVQQHVLNMNAAAVATGTHFLENHDEPRVASLLPASYHRAAAFLILTLPGMRLLHEGQLWGARSRSPVQLVRRALEQEQAEIKQMYEQLFDVLGGSLVGQTNFRLLRPGSWPGTGDGSGCVFVQWQNEPSEFDLAVVNLSPEARACHLPSLVQGNLGGRWKMTNRLTGAERTWENQELVSPGLDLSLTAFGTQLLHFRLD